ncbi:ImmA/IrrE family metallo-endopeptidase [Gracilibacillus alcaliphilus]|uniref:ImmA/IrrE family metallo-endopeptidase n=1 Tax=Gracilibacillus alcaliphilus TaxID=1401441 RepID=UPI00195A62A3|nr:ImmA/IrrE family metallo-endopeptidase [Gracilibacillus alcaliphilus]MBM7678923.1 Zn-dependent peptidase ImmA (M78 family) [Gracilibacillus alcaliphilus]
MYLKTPLEKTIEQELLRLNINTPLKLLKVEEIAVKYDILLRYQRKPSASGIYYGIKVITIDSRLSYLEQRQQFFHELSHVLQHYGDQEGLPKAFVELQEFKARNFALHYAVPTFMIQKLELPKCRDEAISFIANTFKVTEDFARTRLAHYENQITGALFQREIEKHYSTSETVRESPRSIDLYDDLPFWEQPDFKDFITRLKLRGLKDDEVTNIIESMKSKEEERMYK